MTMVITTRRIIFFIFFVLSLFNVTGCFVLDTVNSFGLSGDLKELLKKSGIEKNISCRMMSGSRTGCCKITLSEIEAIALVRALELKELKTQREHLRYQMLKGEGCCQQPSKVRVFISETRPEQLRLNNGGNFQYFLLYYEEISGNSCIQVSYSYG